MRVRFIKDYDHRWPSRAISAFKAGFVGSVKAEVWEGAQAKGAATLEPKAAKVADNERLSDIGRSGRLARPDDAHDVGAVVRDTPLDGAGK